MKCSFGISDFLEEISSLSHSVVSSISLHWLLRKAFLSLLAILWNSAFRCLYLSFSPLFFASLLFTICEGFSAICKASPDSRDPANCILAFPADTQFSSVQFSLSVVSDSLRPHGSSTLGFPVHHQLLELAQTLVHWVGDAIQPSHPLSSPSPPALNLSQHQGLFQWVSSSHQVTKVFHFSLASVLPMNIQDWFPLGWTGWISLKSKRLKSLLQHHSSKASILWCSAFFILQFSHPYMTTGKTIVWTRWTFSHKVVSLLFNMLSGLVIAFLPRSKHLLISWL